MSAPPGLASTQLGAPSTQVSRPGDCETTSGGQSVAAAAAAAVAVVGNLDVEVRTWLEHGTAKAGKSSAKEKESAAQREWQQAFERSSGQPCCVLCLAPYADEHRIKYQTAFCSQGCSVEFGIRSSQSTARRQLYAQQKGVCQRCGLDAHSIYERLVRYTRTCTLRSHFPIQIC